MSEEVAVEDTEDAAVAEEVEPTSAESVDIDAVVDEAPDGEAKVEAEKPEPSESSPEKKDGVQKRIDELTRLRREQERETSYWKELAQNTQVAPEPVAPGKTLADFEYDEGKYTQYLTESAKAEAVAEVDTRLASERQARARADFTSKESDFSKGVDDYYVVTRNQDLKISGEMVEACQGSDEGAAVLYYLGKNPEVAERLAAMPPLSMAREMGKIEASKLVAEKAPSVSKAPKPVPKLAPTDAKVAIDPSNMTDSQFRKWREKAIANR